MSAITKSVTTLKGLSADMPFIVVDPGRKCGVNVVRPEPDLAQRQMLSLHDIETCLLDELPYVLHQLIGIVRPAFLVCEDYTLHGGNRRNDPKMPSAQGIGMVRAAGAWTDTQVYLIQPNQKAPSSWLSPADSEARERCRNDHERDVVDLAVTVLRKLEGTR